MSEKTTKIRATCRPLHGAPGMWSAQRFFPEGTTEHELPESVVLAILGEVERNETAIKIEVLDAKPAKPPKG